MGRRFRRSLLGYSPTAVDAAFDEHDGRLAAGAQKLAGARERIAELELVADRLSERVVVRERELREVQAGLTEARGRSDEAVIALGKLIDELAVVRAQARSQATRIRLRALRDAAEVSDRIAEVALRPAAARERLIEALGDAIGRLAQDSQPVVEAAANGHRTDVEAVEVFKGLVEIEVGPLSDFAQLVGFEDAAIGIGATKGISVRRFAQGRATLELDLAEPVELLRELEERAPFEFKVRDTRDGRVILDLDG